MRRTNVITPERIQNAMAQIHIGDQVMVREGDCKPKEITVVGIYPHFVRATDGRCYQWFDLIRGTGL